MSATGVYLYGLVRSARRPAAAGAPPGIPGASRPRLLAAGPGVWLVAADVPLERYSAERIERGLGDLNWVADHAVAHEAVVERFAARGTLLPMKLFTIFASDERAVAHIAGQRRRIDAILRRIEGCAEWGVKVLGPEPAAPAARIGDRGGSGTAFLAAKKRARDDARAAAGRAGAAAAAVFPALARVAREARRNTPVEPGSRLLLDAAYLVPPARRRAFRAAAARLGARCARAGCELVLSGPWPAYNFLQAAGGGG